MLLACCKRGSVRRDKSALAAFWSASWDFRVTIVSCCVAICRAAAAMSRSCASGPTLAGMADVLTLPICTTHLMRAKLDD